MTVLVSTHYMDEAERCHEIAYMAYGRLLAHGTAAEIVRATGLSTWAVEPAAEADLAGLAHDLTGVPGIDMVATFGASLHVSGGDPARLADATARFRADPAFRWTPADPGLEDAFIHLMAHATDNFA
jgi:ABC-2 type transport system ATP-binding protein